MKPIRRRSLRALPTVGDFSVYASGKWLIQGAPEHLAWEVFIAERRAERSAELFRGTVVIARTFDVVRKDHTQLNGGAT